MNKKYTKFFKKYIKISISLSLYIFLINRILDLQKIEQFLEQFYTYRKIDQVYKELYILPSSTHTHTHTTLSL